jgi:DNA invertase Pin-like site-specific DNA recombinase
MNSYEENIERKVAFYVRDNSQGPLHNWNQWSKELLERDKNWILVGSYNDTGVSGANAYNRPSFMKMIDDAKNKKFDLIVVQSVTRFARKAEDLISYTALLKDFGVEVYFIDENIWTNKDSNKLLWPR